MNITIKNFLFIEDSFLNLDNDMYFVLGQNEISTGSESNGSGKSLFLEAIYYCFVGKSLRGTPLPSLVGPFSQGMSVKVEGETRSGKPYSITRYRSASKSGLEIVFNNESKTFQKTEFGQDFIFETILELTRSQAEIVLYTGEYSPHLLDVTPSIRTSILLGLINYDEETHKKIAEYCKAKISECTQGVARNESELIAIDSKYEKIENSLRVSLAKYQSAVELSQKNYEEANQNKAKINATYKKFLEETDYETSIDNMSKELNELIDQRHNFIEKKNEAAGMLNEKNKSMSGIGSLINSSIDKLLRTTVDGIIKEGELVNTDEFKLPATSRLKDYIQKNKRISVINADSIGSNSEIDELKNKKASLKIDRESKQKLVDRTLKDIATLNEEKKNDTWTCSSCKTVFAKENFAEALEHIQRNIDEKNESLKNLGFDIRSIDAESSEVTTRLETINKKLSSEKEESLKLFSELTEMTEQVAEEQSKIFSSHFNKELIEKIAREIPEEFWNTAGESINTNTAIEKVVECLYNSLPEISEIKSKIVSKIRNGRVIIIDADTSETIQFTLQHRLNKCDRDDLVSFAKKSIELTSNEISESINELRKISMNYDSMAKSTKEKIEDINKKIKTLEESHNKIKTEYSFAVETANINKCKLDEAISILDEKNIAFEKDVSNLQNKKLEEMKEIKKKIRQFSEMKIAAEQVKNEELPAYKRNIIVTFLKKFEVNVNNYLNSIQSDIYCFIDLVDDEVTILFSDISKNKQMLPFSMFSRGERTRIKKVFTQIIVEIFNPIFVLSDESFDGLDNYGMKEIIKFSISSNTGRPYLEASPVDVNTIVEDPCRTILALKRAHETHGAIIDVLDRS